MVFKIVLLTALVTVCSGAHLIHPRGKKSHHASYSQSFTREDVPLSYKYSAVHVYPEKTPEHKPLDSVNNPTLDPISYGGIQYAPLPLKREEEKQQNEDGIFTSDVYTQGTNPTAYEDSRTPEYSSEPTVMSKYLEPKLLTSNPTFKSPVQFVPGHNIVPSPAYQGLNFKDYHGTKSQSQNLVNYIHEFKNYENQEKSSTEPTIEAKMIKYFAAVTTDSPRQELYTFVPKNMNHQQYQLNYQPTDERYQMEQLATRAKVPQLHLNIAREFKFAHMPQAAPAHVSLSRFHSFPVQAQAIIKPLFPKESSQNATRLYPKNLHMSIYSRS